MKTKAEWADMVNSVNVTAAFTMLSSWFPFLGLPIISHILKAYLAKKLLPLSAEGVVYVAFSAIDAEQNSKAQASVKAVSDLRKAIDGGNADELQQANDQFDDSFIDAIRVKPKP